MVWFADELEPQVESERWPQYDQISSWHELHKILSRVEIGSLWSLYYWWDHFTSTLSPITHRNLTIVWKIGEIGGNIFLMHLSHRWLRGRFYFDKSSLRFWIYLKIKTLLLCKNSQRGSSLLIDLWNPHKISFGQKLNKQPMED